MLFSPMTKMDMDVLHSWQWTSPERRGYSLYWLVRQHVDQNSVLERISDLLRSVIEPDINMANGHITIVAVAMLQEIQNPVRELADTVLGKENQLTRESAIDFKYNENSDICVSTVRFNGIRIGRTGRV